MAMARRVDTFRPALVVSILSSTFPSCVILVRCALLACLLVAYLSTIGAAAGTAGPAVGAAGQSRYILLPGNSFNAKCLDGSAPGYQYRRGYGGASTSWHIHLPGGGWCSSLSACQQRAKTKLGSTRGMQRLATTASSGASNDNGDPDAPQRGITSGVRSVNPTFYHWHLVRPLYCDGGGFTGQAGYRPGPNGSQGVHMDGWRIIHAILQDLRTSRGMTSPTRILLSGSSAGGQAVVTLCDLLPLLFPRARVKCIMDAGLFVDAEDRQHTRAFASMVKATVGLHRMRVNWRCTEATPPGSQWRCFFPHQALRFVASPVLVVNSLFDYRALMLGRQLPSDQVRATACLRQIAREGGTDLLRFVKSQTWCGGGGGLAGIQTAGMFPGGDLKGSSNRTGGGNRSGSGDSREEGVGNKTGKGGVGAAAVEVSACEAGEQRAVLNVAWQMVQYTDAAQQQLGPTVSTFVTPAIAHCALTSPKWDSLTDKGVTLKDAVTNWYKRPL